MRLLRGQAVAGVAQADFHPSIRQHPHGDDQPPLANRGLRHGLGSVENQVEQQLLQLDALGDERWQCQGKPGDQFDVTPFQLGAQQRQCFADQRQEVDGLASIGAGPHQTADGLDDVRGTLGQPQAFCYGVLESGVSLQHRRETELDAAQIIGNGPQGLVDFVGHHRCQLAGGGEPLHVDQFAFLLLEPIFLLAHQLLGPASFRHVAQDTGEVRIAILIAPDRQVDRKQRPVRTNAHQGIGPLQILSATGERQPQQSRRIERPAFGQQQRLGIAAFEFTRPEAEQARGGLVGHLDPAPFINGEDALDRGIQQGFQTRLVLPQADFQQMPLARLCLQLPDGFPPHGDFPGQALIDVAQLAGTRQSHRLPHDRPQQD